MNEAQHPLLVVPPQRLMVAGDWHMNTAWAIARLQSAAAHGVELIVHLGDFGYWPGSPAGQHYLEAVQNAAARGGLHVAWIDGNHEQFSVLEFVDQKAEGGLATLPGHPNIHHIPRATRWVWDGLRFGGLGGATSVDVKLRFPQVDWFPDESLTDADVAAWQAGGPVDVVFCHDRPAGVVTPGVTRASGAALWGEDAMDDAEWHAQRLAEALMPTRPRLVFHGHLHTRYTAVWEYEGGSARVEGLDCDGTPGNTLIITVDEMADWCAQVGER